MFKAFAHQWLVGPIEKPTVGQKYACITSTRDVCPQTPSPRLLALERKRLWNLPLCLLSSLSSMPLSRSSQDAAVSVVAHPALVPDGTVLYPVGSQDSLGWKGPLKVIWSSHLLKAYCTVRTGCSGLRPVEFWTSPRMQTPHPVWATWFSVWPTSRRSFS